MNFVIFLSGEKRAFNTQERVKEAIMNGKGSLRVIRTKQRRSERLFSALMWKINSFFIYFAFMAILQIWNSFYTKEYGKVSPTAGKFWKTFLKFSRD